MTMLLADHNRVRRVLVACAATLSFAACDGSATGPDRTPTYNVTAGACGKIVFTDAIAADSASAIAVIKSRKAEQFGASAVTIEPYGIEVVDEDGNAPEPRFYALKVLDPQTGMLVHSVSEVITTKGQLFHLHWCLD